MNINLKLSNFLKIAVLIGKGALLMGAFGVFFLGVNFFNQQNGFGLLPPKTASAVVITHNTCVGGRCISVDGFGVSDCDINDANSCLNAPQSHLSCGRPVPGGGFTCLYDPNGIQSCNEGGACAGDPTITGVTCKWLGTSNQCVADPFGRDTCTVGTACGGFGGGNPPPGGGGNTGGGGGTGSGGSGGGVTITGASCDTGNQCFVNPLGTDTCDPFALAGQANGCGGIVPPPPTPSGTTGTSCNLFSATADGSNVYFCYADPLGQDNCLTNLACRPGGSIGTYCSGSGVCIQTNLAPGQASAGCSVGQSCTPPNPTPTQGHCTAPGFCSTSPGATGPSCSLATDCPSTFPTICGVGGTCIQSAASGTPCVSSSDCSTTQTPRCNANNQCVLGGSGASCVLGNNATCLQALGCSGLTCAPGGTGGPCSTSADCQPKPGIPHCAGLVCNEYVTQGNICSSYKDCQPLAGCNQYQQCVYGGTLGTCNNNYDCLAPLGCNSSTKQCIPGGKDGGCYTNADCKDALGCNASTQQCVEGGKDGSCKSNTDCQKPLGCDNYQRCVPGGYLGSCSNNADCQPKPRCNDITQKCVNDGTGTGSVCSKESDCQVTRCTQTEPYKCVPYGQGGTGRVCSLDSANPDKVCQPPPKKGRIVINKFAKGGDDSFDFYVNPSPVFTTLSTAGGNATTFGRATTYFDAEPGTKENPIRYNIAEILPDHWSFVGANCDRSFILTTNSVEEVSVESDETTTCNFYNVKNGSIKIINNNASYPNPNTETAEYAVFPSPIYETITAQGPKGDGIDHEVLPGTYTIYQNTPLDWNLTSVTCKQGSGSDLITPVVNGAVTLTVRPGETTTCTFNNKSMEGNLIINKHASGGSDRFYFDITRTGLAGGTTRSEYIDAKNNVPQALPLKIAPGTYNISEIVPAGWVLAQFSCINTTYSTAENGVINVEIVDGKTTICDFYNTKKGYLKIVKEATDGDDTFDYKIDNYSAGQGGVPATATAKITTSSGKGDSGLLEENEGEYNIIETMPDGWRSNGSIACDNGSFTQAVGDVYGVLGVKITNGKTTTCTFKNIKKGKPVLKIKKETTGGDDTFNFKIENDSAGVTTAPLNSATSVTTTRGKGTSEDLSENPGGYNVTEDMSGLTDWTFTSAQCTKEDGTPTGTLDAANNRVTSVSLVDGQTTTCTFRNYKKNDNDPGKLKIVKETEGQGNSTEVFYFNIDVATFGLSSDKASTQTASVITYQSKDKNSSNKGSGDSGVINEEPGTYNIAEDFARLPAGWKLESAYCDHGSFTVTDNGVMNVQIVAGVTTTCTFKNTKTGSLVIKKKTGLGDGDAEFNFSVSPGINDVIRIKTKNGNGTNNGNCPDGSGPGSDGKCSDQTLPNSPVMKLPRNSYTILEKNPTAWATNAISCVKEDKTPTGIFDSRTNSIANVIIEFGQTTTCTFTNSKNKGGGSGGGGGYRPDQEILPPLDQDTSPY